MPSLRNPMYDMLLLHKPSREGIARALFGGRSVSTVTPNRQQNVDAIFAAAPSARAAMEGQVNQVGYPKWMMAPEGAMSGLGGFGDLGALPEAATYIPINHPGGKYGPWDVGDAVFGISRGWGKIDGLAPGNLRVPNFAARYQKAQALSAAAEAFAEGTPIKNLANQLEGKMASAMTAVLNGYLWDAPCGFGTDPESPVWDNCRTKGQVDRLKNALADVNNVLRGYENQLAPAIPKAPPEWRVDYIAPIDFGVDTGGTSSTTGQEAYTRAFSRGGSGTSTGSQSMTQSRGASTAGGLPGWALPVAGVAMLGVLVGGLVFLKKKKG